MASKRRALRQKGISLILGSASLIAIIPSVGLSVDVGILYVSKARLQAAVDGASLAAARALSLNTTPSSQATTAIQNATNWFYANLQGTNWGATGTTITTTVDDTTTPYLRVISTTATTNAPTYFMKWFGYGSITISANGTASRRDVVIVMIMDRSSSMNSANGCTNMRSAAKIFTGQFAPGRDRIGMVEFSDTAFVDTDPTTSFQTVLGYTNTLGTGIGLIDTITCNGHTNTPQALSIGYNELAKMNLPGAFNILLFFTDGIPNSLTLNYANVMLGTSGCKDSTGTAVSAGGNLALHPPSWTSGWTIAPGISIPAGPIGMIGSDDPSGSSTYAVLDYAGTSQGSTGQGNVSAADAPGCYFPNNSQNYTKDFLSLPPTDVYGNSLVDQSYNALTLNGSGNVVLAATQDPGTALTGNNLLIHYAARNAAYEASVTARTNANLPATIFGVGLGGTSQAPPGYDFMQMVTNDPNGDLFNSPALYGTCASETATCAKVQPNSQPQGKFIFSSNPDQLQNAFLIMSSQILRLAK